MSIVAGIAVDAEDFAIGQVLSHSTTRIELTQFVPTNSSLAPYIWKDRNGEGDPEAFEREVRADERVATLRHLGGRADAHLYRIEWATDGDEFVTALDDHDIIVEEGRTTDDGAQWMFRLRAWDQEALSGFQSDCYDTDVPLDVRRVYHNPVEHADGIGRLSGDQREALVVGLQKGYFDIPRGHTQAEVADELGITRQAFSRRLRRAQRNAFEDLLWQDLTDEGTAPSDELESNA